MKKYIFTNVITIVFAGALMFGLTAVAPPDALAATGLSNPASNYPIPATLNDTCWWGNGSSSDTCYTSASYTTVAPCYVPSASAPSGYVPAANQGPCIAAWVNLLNQAAASEGVGPISLPSNFAQLNPNMELIAVINAERTARGLDPYIDSAGLNVYAQRGANAGTDPSGVPSNYSQYSWSSDWAGGGHAPYPGGVLRAVFSWLYDDGWGGSQANTFNFACTSPSASGCWGHRNSLLGNYLPGGASCTNCRIGVGYAANVNGWSGTYTAIIAPPPNGPAPSPSPSGPVSDSTPGFTGYCGAFTANTSILYTDTNEIPADTTQGMMSGTSPSVTQLANTGCEEAFQANTGNLVVVGAGGNINTGQGMMRGTSPSITAVGGGFEVAFQANNGFLYIYSSVSGPVDTGLGMMRDTSPSIATVNGGYEVAFQANTGDLWTFGSGGEVDTGLGMMAGTSPSIEGGYGYSGGNIWSVAFQANTGDLWIGGYVYGGAWYDSYAGMMPGTSPSITIADQQWMIAFQANNGQLFLRHCWAEAVNAAGQTISSLINTGQGMMLGTSPSVVG